jgi:methylmalonyl-CoA/ethylmalonyl-CoA epimerase
MREARDIARWIGQLADPDSAQRDAAAALLYGEGALLFSSATSEWMKDREFRALVCSPEPVVGIAVQPKTFEAIRAANGSPLLADVPPDQDAQEFELELGGGHFDILTTRAPNSAGTIARYLQKFGEGIQQIEINVSDVDRATEILGAQFGIDPVYPATRPGAGRTRVNFLLVPAQGKKALIELVEAT